LALAGRPGEGEEALRRAVRQRGDLAETWLALIAHLARVEQVRDAEEVREEMRRCLPADQVPLALAVCEEVLDRLDDAEAQYRQALARTPNDGAVLQRAARFYLRLNRTGQAEPLLRRMLAPETDVSAVNQTWARRHLSLLLAFDRGDSGYRLALALLDENPRPAVDAVLDRRARLFIQGTRAEERSAAVRLLEESSKVHPFTAEELFYLVRLHELGGAEDAARERRLDLLALDRNNPEYLAHHIHRLLQRGRKDEARPWIVRLQKLIKN
jgi:tetratricopeptide (TPR) repeat protein